MNLNDVKNKRVRLSSFAYDLDKRCIVLAKQNIEEQTQSSYDKWGAEVIKRDIVKNLVGCLANLEKVLLSATEYKEIREYLEGE